MRHATATCALLLTLCTCALGQQGETGGARQTPSYATVSAVTVSSLSNGVQIRINSDGFLQFRTSDTSGRIMQLSFPDARNGTGKSFINVNRYPVSHVQLSTPQGAVSGIGLNLQITNFVATEASVTQTPDGTGVLITIQSDRTIDPGRRRTPDASRPADAPPDVTTQVNYADGLLSLRAVKADIHALMAAVASKSGLNIAVDDAVTRTVSLNLQAVPATSAIRSIATAYGLALSETEGIFMMSEGVPTDLATYHLSGTQSFRMQNTQAQTASGLLPNFLFSYVKVNLEQNAVVVTAPRQMLNKIGADLGKVDVPSPQIAIEAVAVEFNDTVDRDFGLSLGLVRANGQASLDTDLGSVYYSTIGLLPNDFAARVRALELSGKARVRASPQMAAVNGQEASLFIGAQRFIQVQYQQWGQVQTRIQPVDVGVKLYIRPLTGGNNEITLTIVPEVSNITELDLETGLPVLSTRRAETTVRVKHGETVAIGGLRLSQEQSSSAKIPLLGDIPILGGLFRSTSRSTVQTDLTIFVTPRIMDTEAQTALQPNAEATAAGKP